MRKLSTSLLLTLALAALVVPQSLIGGSGKVGGQGVVRRAAAGGGGTTVVYDTFTSAAGELISTHTGETGATWTITASADTWVMPEDRLTGASDTIRVYPSGTPASADYDSQFALFIASDTTSFYTRILMRHDTAAPDYYFCGYLGNGQKWQIGKVIGGGVASELGSYAQVLTVSNTYVGRCRVEGTTLKLDVDSVERISVTDSAITATGKSGVVFDAVQGTTTGYHVDYLWVGPNGGTVGP